MAFVTSTDGCVCFVQYYISACGSAAVLALVVLLLARV